ncbi:MAG TPA: hypothetical protein VFW25_13385 [Silvibacterium sp.]|nr:hypothetical protein [Silvibacterium sp.]
MPSSDLLSRYLQAIGFWLPRATKHDILAEISEDLHSQIDDRAAGLGRLLNDAEIAAVLKQRGRPFVVAGTFLPQRQLIGPVLFPIYLFVLKIVTLCYLLPWFLVWIGCVAFGRGYLVRHSGSELQGLSTLWILFWTLFGVITFIFAILDRTSNRAKLISDWDPRKLPKMKPEQARRMAKDIAGIVFGVLGIVWLLAIPRYPFLILGGGVFFIKFAPVWRTAYPWFFLICGAGIAENIVGLLRNMPAWVRPVIKLAGTSLSLWIVFTLLRAHTWFVAQAGGNPHWVLIVNSIAFFALSCNSIILLIVFIVQAWKLSKWNSPASRIPLVRNA